MSKVAIIGAGYVGSAYHKVFPDAVIYDEPKGIGSRIEVNACDIALIAVPTNVLHVPELTKGGVKDHKQLDMSIIEDVVEWLDTPLILIKSALQPGTVDKLVEKTGKKIAVSVEMVGQGGYFTPFWKYPSQTDPTSHNFLIVGGEDKTARACADYLWEKMSPDISIHLVSAVEAELCKLMENTWGAMKVTFSNVMYDIAEKYGANYTKILQAWGVDGRTEKMHMRVLPWKRGWKSHCFDKDIPALAELDETGFLKALIKANKEHIDGH